MATRYANFGARETTVSSAARTTNGDTGISDGWGLVKTLRLQLAVTAVSGTGPTLDVVIEDTLDGTNWHQVGAFAQRTSTGAVALDITNPFTDRIRVRWTVGGTAPSFTFSVITYYE